MAVQGHPRSLIFVPIESAYATSVIVTLVPSCAVSEILQVFVLLAPPIFHPNFKGVPVAPDRRPEQSGFVAGRSTMDAILAP